MNIFLPISLNMDSGAQKNHLIETVLLSTTYVKLRNKNKLFNFTNL